jgi:hypothetical protein
LALTKEDNVPQKSFGYKMIYGKTYSCGDAFSKMQKPFPETILVLKPFLIGFN